MSGCIAIVPARGGSKGISDKNLRVVAGRPLVCWSIAAALEADLDRVIVSTDSERIAEVARASGAEVPFLRPAELARDDTRDLPVFQHVLEEIERRDGDRPELVVHLRPTSPARPVHLIDRAVHTLRTHADAHSVRSVSLAAHSPYKMWSMGDSGLLEPLLGTWEAELYNEPRQVLPDTWWHNGVIDVIRRPVILGGSMTGRRVLGFPVPDDIVVDIDRPADLYAAEGALERSGLIGRIGR